MEQRVTLITLGVADLARSRRFYEQGLGWQNGFTDGDVAFYQANGLIVALWNVESLRADARLGPGSVGTGAIALAHNVRTHDEVDAVLHAAAAAGATILRPAAEAPWGGYTAYFADPDGHPWEVAWNPGFAMDEAGNVRLES